MQLLQCLVTVCLAASAYGQALESRCPKGYLNWGRFCYYFSDTAYTFDESRAVCKNRGADLLSMNNMQEFRFIQDEVKRRRLEFWVGATDLPKKDKKYKWVDRSRWDPNVAKAAWAKNQPDGLRGHQNCAKFWNRPPGSWDDVECGRRVRFICKRRNDYIDKCDLDAGYHSFSNQCFKYNEEPQTWTDAQATCEADGAQLIVVDKPEKLNYLADTITCSDSRANVWLGLSDTLVPGTLIWVDASPVVIKKWDSNQPAMLTPGSTCVESVPQAGHKWRTQPCEAERKFICQKPQGKCKAGWVEKLDQCYQINSRRDTWKTWSDADEYCRSQGASLVKITNQRVQNNVNSFLANIRKAKADAIFIGISDKTEENVFKWYDETLVSSGYKKWERNQPAKVNGRMDCGVIKTDARLRGSWRTDYCFNRRAFICQHPIWVVPDNVTEPGDCKMTHDGQDYMGTVSVTGTGKVCQSWDSQFPHKHTIGTKDSDFPDRTVKDAKNYCRNPDKWPWGVWCFTTDSKVQWELCDQIPFCQENYRCELGWTMYEDNCYKFMDDPKPWSDARAGCQQEQADLTSVSGWDEQSFLSNNMLPDQAWIGLHDLSTEGKFAWTDGTPYNFSNWHKGEPNDWRNNEDCVVMKKTASEMGAWNDGRCHLKIRYICKKPAYHILNPPTSTPIPTTKPFSPMCGPGWVWDAVGGFCYQLNPDAKLDWPAARADCISKGSDLMSIVSLHEQSFVSALILSDAGHGTASYWIGANDRDDTSGWRWSDGSPFRWVNWIPGQPDRKEEHCVALIALHGMWNDDDCPDLKPYICKKSSIQATTVAPSPTTAPPNCNSWPMLSGFHSLQDGLMTSSSNLNKDHSPREARIDVGGCKDTTKGIEYKGFRAWTDEGYTCQRWDSQYPHKHSYTDASKYPDATLGDASNYCRNPGSEEETEGPWCYTTNPDVRWRYCGIPMCTSRGPPVRAWMPNRDDKNQWIQANFMQEILVKGIIVMARQDQPMWVTKYKLQYGYDTTIIEWYQDPPGRIKILDGVSVQNTPKTSMLTTPFEASYVRLWPTAWSSRISVRWEILGCIPEDCKDEYLVTGDTIVPDALMTASSNWAPNHGPSNARLHNVKGGGQTGAWSAGTNNAGQWIQVDLRNLMRIKAVVTQGRSDYDQWITQFKISYSLDGTKFIDYTQPYGYSKIFDGNVDRNTLKINEFKSPFIAQKVRLLPISWKGHISLRWDLRGCLPGCQPTPRVKDVRDKQLRASSNWNARHGPGRSRLNTKREGGLVGAWCSKRNDGKQWLQVDFMIQYNVRGIATQGRADNNQWVTEYRLHYSTHGRQFYPYRENNKIRLFDGNWDRNTIRKYYFGIPFVARKVRIWPTKWFRHTSLRWDVFGCPASTAGVPIGCFADNPKNRDLPFVPLGNVGGLTQRVCVKHCFDRGYHYAGAQNGKNCYCGNSYGRYGPSTKCNKKCPGEPEANCGGVNVNFVYGTGISSEDERCMPGWVDYEDTCYSVMQTKSTWTDAQNDCKVTYGGDLATINNFETQAMITSLVGPMRQMVWIGMNDLNFKNFYEWVDQTPVLYTNWRPAEPNNHRGQNERCVVMGSNGKWNDAMCDKRKYWYLCQTQKQILPTPSGAPPVDDRCDGGWLGYSYSCYSFLNVNKRTWQQANQYCKSLKATLVRINNRYENAFLTAQLNSMTGEFWTDLTDKAKPGTYQWSNGHSYIPYTHWAKGEPDDSKGQCVTLGSKRLAGLWYDRNCGIKRGLVCEKLRRGFTSPAMPTPTVITAPCAAGWSDYLLGSYCYKVSAVLPNYRLNWLDARKNCIDQGAELASFHDDDEHDFVYKNFIFGESDEPLWIGLNNRDTEEGHKWSDGSSVTYTNWADGEPNNWGDRENCVEMKNSDGKWNDMNCGRTRNWVCKIQKGITPIDVTTVSPPSAGPPGSCYPDNDDWKFYNGYCYYVGKGGDEENLEFMNAHGWCRSNGGALASIHSQEEQDFLWGLIRPTSFEKVYIGLNELDQNGWLWIDRTPTDYVNWNKGEPNDWGGAERCVNMYSKTGYWNDEQCNMPHSFICKKSKGSTPAPPTPPLSLPGNCPTGYLTFGIRCFKLVGKDQSTWTNWTDARAQCQKEGSGYDLASIKSPQAQAFLTAQMVDMPTAVWIGMSRHFTKKFFWINNELVTYTNWNNGEPNGDDREECAEMLDEPYHAGKWNDVPCDVKLGYVCQTFKIRSIPNPPPTPPNSCGTDFYPHGNGCYSLIRGTRNWDMADSYCKQRGGNIASIVTQFEQAFIWSMIQTEDLRLDVWIGLSDKMVPGTYRWSDRWPVLFTKWGKNEPKATQQCVVMDYATSTWKTAPCNQQFPVVCKITTDQPPYIPSPGNGQCPDDDGEDWANFNGYCYAFKQDSSKNFAEANFDCQLLNAELTTIHSEDENHFIGLHMQQNSGAAVWIGMMRSRSGGFQWKDGSPLQYTNWGNGEPSDVNGTDGENCVELYGWNLKWNDLACDQKRGFVCKMPQIDPGTAGTPPNTGTPPSDRPGMTTTIPAWTWPPIVTGGQTTRARWTWPPIGISTTRNWPPVWSTQGIVATVKPPGISGGAVAGIIMAVLVVIVILAIIVYKMRAGQQSKSPTSVNEAFDNPVYSTSSGSVQMGSETPSYSYDPSSKA
ncbi:unnamed protein product [Owenia fusiformis]|uniref:Macrophage mannose receptor 1-like n=1 Tax=Owenia fusiformis TaxID=6347 RepID=A0A8S4NG16_OWEFU|nr:unnamed protein product [Owenia fusiformis]